MNYGQDRLTGPPVTPAVSAVVLETLEAIAAAHSRIDALEGRILGDQPKNPEGNPPPNGLAHAAMLVRSMVISLNDRLDRLSGAI